MRIRYWRSYVCSSDLGFTQPRMHAMLKELAVAPESGRALLRAAHGRRELRATPYVDRSPQRAGEPVLLVPGFLAGDYTLGLLARTLRSNGFRTYRSPITSNVSCLMGNSSMLERRLERSEEHTSELQSLIRISYAVFRLKKNHTKNAKLTIH